MRNFQITILTFHFSHSKVMIYFTRLKNLCFHKAFSLIFVLKTLNPFMKSLGFIFMMMIIGLSKLVIQLTICLTYSMFTIRVHWFRKMVSFNWVHHWFWWRLNAVMIIEMTCPNILMKICPNGIFFWTAFLRLFQVQVRTFPWLHSKILKWFMKLWAFMLRTNIVKF